nr:High mobility group HMG1 HMG2 [Hymenolepis microstoma]
MGCAKSSQAKMENRSLKPTLCNAGTPKRLSRRVSLASDKPKRPPNAYVLFMQDNVSLWSGDIASFSRKVAAKWKNLDPKQKAIYVNKAHGLMSHYKGSCPNSKCSDYLTFVCQSYKCLRSKHPDWSSQKIMDVIKAEYRRQRSSRN